MILASLVGIFAIPPLYVTFQSMRERLRPSARPKTREETREGPQDAAPGSAPPAHARDAEPARPSAAAE